jgi:hypothetical protein
MKEDIKALKILHMAICMGMVLIYTILIGVSEVEFKIPVFDQENLMFSLVPFAAIILSYFVFKFQLKRVDPKATLEEKFPQYRIACISRWGILEATIILIIFLKPDLIIFGILLIIVIISLHPTEDGIRTDFQSLNS